MEPTEHFGIYFRYIRRLFQSWVKPLKTTSKKGKHPYSNASLRCAKREGPVVWTIQAHWGEAALANFKRAKNDLRKLARQFKKDHENKLAQNITKNLRIFWKYVRSKQKTRVRVEELEKEDGTRAHSSREKAEALNQFF